MELDYVLFDPTGNITVLVQTPVPVPEQPRTAAALMSAEPAAEQVGFLSPGGAGADVTLRMAGGEFCGNAAMCAAAAHCEETHTDGGRILVRVSGAEAPVEVSLTRRPDGAWRCSERFPQRPQISDETLRCDGGTLQAPLVRLGAISHLILPAGFDRDEAASRAPAWCAELRAEALGLMLFDEAAGRLTPLVYVPGAGTLFWERSCASGSAAVGAYLARRRGGPVAAELAQPGGTLHVEADPVGKILLRGSVEVLKVGTVLLN